MTLDEYLAAKKQTQRAFALHSGIPYRTVHRTARTGRCGGRTAVVIERVTHENPTPAGGYVTVEELVSSGSAAA